MTQVSKESSIDQNLPPPAIVLQMVTGRWVSHMVGVAAELGLADVIQKSPRTAEEIAALKNLHAPSLYRLLRGLASIGIFAEQEGGKFSQTPLSDTLRSDVPYSVRGMARMVNLESTVRAWTALEHSVRTGESAFEHIHGMQGFAYFDKHPRDRDIFASAMSSFTAQIAGAVAEAYDFSQAKVLADIGGSHGMVLAGVLAKNPQLKGILFDLPGVVAGAKPLLEKHQISQRVECVGGNFFEKVPSGADIYVMKHILHDWGDSDCVRILQTIHQAANAQSKLILVESVLEEANRAQFAKILDIEMLAITHGGKERTLTEWKKLFKEAGWQFSRVIETAAPVSIIEAVR